MPKPPYVEQSGNITPGHYATWSATGVIQDGGPVPSAPVVGPPVEQSGEVTPTHLAVWTYDGVIQDGGEIPSGLLGWLFRQGPFTGVTNPITLSPGTAILLCDSTGGPVALQLPAPSTSAPHVVIVVDLNGTAATNNITITVSGGSFINGLPGCILIFNRQSSSLADCGTVWSII